MRVKKKDKAVIVSVIAWHCGVLTVLYLMGQRGFKYSDITAARNICTPIRSPNSSQKHMTITHSVAKYTSVV
jgi:hypothetical protein